MRCCTRVRFLDPERCLPSARSAWRSHWPASRDLMAYQGRVSSWKDDKGFGFIRPDGGGDDVFVHASAFVRLDRRPEPGDAVIYNLSMDGRGRWQATGVAFHGARAVAAVFRAPSASAGRSIFAPAFAGSFLLLVLLATVFGRLPIALLAGYCVMSGVAFCSYAWDKSAARQNRWRTPESTLHLLALMGGWPGALVAQQRLRHKTAKVSFLAAFWLTMLINCGVLGWLLTPSGASVLRALMGVA